MTLENLILFSFPCRNHGELLTRLWPHSAHENLQFGYLGVEKQLEALIAEDAKKLAELGLTHERIADEIERLFECAEKRVNGNLIVQRHYIHSPICPWGDFTTTSPFDCMMKTTELLVLNRERCPQDIEDFLTAQE